MAANSKNRIAFARLPEIELTDIIAHMSDPRLAEHMPLLTKRWDQKAVSDFVATKEGYWARDGLGHWAILHDGRYVGWGGFQKEGNEWDYGLVLKPDSFGLGVRITKQAISFAHADKRIPFITFLVPPTRKNLGALTRMGAVYLGDTDYDGAAFRKYRLDTS